MPGFEIVQERTVSFDEHGHRTSSARGYVKLDESIEPLLALLNGVPLSFFMCVSAHEPSVCLGKSSPYTLKDLERILKVSERALRYATKILVPTFVYVCGTNTHDEKMYRPCETYAWFGDDKPAGHRGAKIAPRNASSSGRPSLQPQAPGVQPIAPRLQKDASWGAKRRDFGVQKDAIEVVVSSSSPNKEKGKTTTTEARARVRQILSAAGFYGKPLETLSGTVAEDLANRWARWISWAEEFARDAYHSPAGLALYHLLDNSQTEPLDSVPDGYGTRFGRRDPELIGLASAEPTSDTESDDERDETSPHGDGAEEIAPAPKYCERRAGERNVGDIWHAALAEVQLQMTKATFDTWVRPTWARGWDDEGMFVIGVHSPYAVEWLEHSLDTTIKRTLTGILGRAVTVRYVVKDKVARERKTPCESSELTPR